MEKWVLAAKRADFQEIGRKYGIDPVIARIIRNRDIIEEKDIAELKTLLEEHVNATDSPKGKEILAHFEEYIPKFKKIIPKEYEALGGTL